MSEDKKLRMNAYYYGFEETGVYEIDLILSAVASAGKGFHHTESWTEEIKLENYGPFRGENFQQAIQNAANDAAQEWNHRAPSEQWRSLAEAFMAGFQTQGITKGTDLMVAAEKYAKEYPSPPPSQATQHSEKEGKCPECHGSGKIQVRHGGPGTESEQDFWRCPTCQGKGVAGKENMS